MVTQTGFCSLLSGEISGGLAKTVRLCLTPERLVLQEELRIDKSGPSYLFYQSGLPVVGEVSLCRDHRGSLGFSIRGGSENRLPVLISHIQRNQPASKSKSLFVGDAILRIDHLGVEGLCHDEVVRILKNAGQQVTLVVRHYRQAAKLLMASHQISDNSSTGRLSVSISKDKVFSSVCNKNVEEKQKLLACSDDSLDQCKDLNSSVASDDAIVAACNIDDANTAFTVPLAFESFSTLPSSSSLMSALELPATPTSSLVEVHHRVSIDDRKSPDHRWWTDIITIPLKYSQLTRYIPRSDVLRHLSFELIGLNGHSTGCLSFTTPEDFNRWYFAIQANIDQLLDGILKEHNRREERKLQYIGWLSLTLYDSPLRNKLWQDVFVALRGDDLLLFEVPPIFLSDWNCYSFKEKIYKCAIRVLDDSELYDKRQHAFFLHCGPEQTYYMSAQSVNQVYKLEKVWLHTVSAVLSSTTSKQNLTFSVTHAGEPGRLTLDFTSGISFVSQVPGSSHSFTYGFARLRRSHDDHDRVLYLHFATDFDSEQLDVRELVCADLQLLLIVLHSFYFCKLSLVDPHFLAS